MKPIKAPSKKAMDSDRAITVIGGELSYDFLNSIESSFKLYGVRFNPKNNNIIAYGDSSSITIYSVNLEPIAHLESKNGEVKSVAISLDGNYLVSGGDDGYIEIWDLNSGYRLLHRVESGSVNAVAISGDNRQVASGGDDRVLDIGI